MATRLFVDTAATVEVQYSKLEGWWFVAFGDVFVVESAFGFDGALAVVLAGASAFGHHRPAPGAGFDDGFLSGWPQFAGRCAQGGNSSMLPGWVV